jgi:hypothetical protein
MVRRISESPECNAAVPPSKAIARIWRQRNAYAIWLASNWIAWGSAATFGIALTYACQRPVLEHRSRWAGLALQIIGVGLGIPALLKTRNLFGLPSPLDAARAWWAGRPKSSVIVPFTGVGGEFKSGTVGVSEWSAMGQELGIPQRVDALESNVERLRIKATAWQPSTESSLSALRQTVANDAATVHNDVGRVSRTLLESQAGGFAYACVALAFILVGTTMTGIAPVLGASAEPHLIGAAQNPPTSSVPPVEAAADLSPPKALQHAVHSVRSTCLGVPAIACNYDPDQIDHHLITEGEFLALVGFILALKALAKPSVDFRLRVAAISTMPIILVVLVLGLFILTGALLPYWEGRRWPVIGYSLPWEFSAVLMTLLGSLWVLYRAFGSAKFSRRNAKRYWQATTSFIARGDDNALAELADEIFPSVKRVVRVCSRFDYEAAQRAKDSSTDFPISNYTRIAITLLDLWSDRRLCAVMVKRAPGTAIALVEEIRAHLNPKQGGRSCISAIVDQALTEEDSLLFREEEFSPLGRYHIFTDAIASHYEFVESDFRPLQGWDLDSRWQANAKQVAKYGELLLCALNGYFKHADFGRFPAGLWSAFRQLAELGPRRAQRLRNISESSLSDDQHLAVLNEISNTLAKAIRAVCEKQQVLPEYPLDAAVDWRFKDPSLYAVLANAVYAHFESLGQVLAHDSVISGSVMEIWQEIFPIPSAANTTATLSIQERLVGLLKKKVEENLRSSRPYYPALTRLLISIVGLPVDLDQLPDDADREFIRWFLEMLRDNYAELALKHPRIAKDMLPEFVSFDLASSSLVTDSKLRGGRAFPLRRASAP